MRARLRAIGYSTPVARGLLAGRRRRLKLADELRYWRERAAVEGLLENEHYRTMFTRLWELPESFYVGKRMLDVGCGPRGSLEWASCAAERVGIDPLADEYVRLAGARHAMTYVRARAEAIPFPDGHFDVVSSLNSIDHVDDLDRAIAELSRVAAPGATLLMIVEVHDAPTLTEPQAIGWELARRFQPAWEDVQERRCELQTGLILLDAERGVPYDDSDPRPRRGLLLARMQRRATPTARV